MTTQCGNCGYTYKGAQCPVCRTAPPAPARNALDIEELVVKVKCARCSDTGVDPDPVPVCCGRPRSSDDGNPMECCGSPDPAPQPCKACSDPPAETARALEPHRQTDAEREAACGGYYSTLARGGR